MALFPRYDGPPLMDRVCSVENLTVAWRRVRGNIQATRRGRSAGPDSVTVRDFEADWARQMAQLADELRTGAYRPLPPRRVQIPKSSGGERAIAILAVRDRVAQRAVHQVLEPLFDPLFLDCSYGCRPRVGVPEALARVARYAEQGLSWVADGDITDYFGSIDQRILLSLLRQRVDELPLLHLIAQWLRAGTMNADDASQAGSSATVGPLAWSGRAFRQVLDWGGVGAHPPAAGPGVHDPYAEMAWEQASWADMPAGMQRAYPIGLEQKVWTAVSLAQPVLGGVRRALPYVRKLGSHPAVMVGAAAAGAVAAGGLALQSRGSGRRGTVQGGALSPLLANVYLHPFDLALTSRGLRLVRFVDDFVIMCADQAEAEQALDTARRQLGALRLTLHDQKSSVMAYADGLEFLGQALAPPQQGRRLGHGLTSFADAEQALREAARKLRRKK